MSTPLMAITGLTKTFDGASGYQLGPVDITIATGETLGVLGKNGAGKTTLFQILTGNLDASSGEVRFGDAKLTPDTPEIKRRLGYLPQNPVLPRWATGREILTYAASLFGLSDIAKRIPAAEEHWDCASFAGKPLATMSYGMQKRVALALATLHDPEFLVLDEPFSGLDLFHIKTLEDEIVRRTKTGRATILSTHVASFCATLCHRVLIVDSGRVTPLSGWEQLDQLGRISAIEKTFFARQSGGTT